MTFSEITFQETSYLITILLLLAALTFSILFVLKKIKINRSWAEEKNKLLSSKLMYLTCLFAVLLVLGIFSFSKLEAIKVVTLTAAEFKTKEASNIKMLQEQQTPEALNKASQKFIIFDLRKPEEAYQGQIKGTNLMPYSRFIKVDDTIKPLRKVAIFSTQDRRQEAQEIAKRLSTQDIPKIYVISDGYEGLVKAGFIQKEKPGFEEE